MTLSAIDPRSDWAYRTSGAFGSRSNPKDRLVVLPLCGFGDWGFGRPLDLEENLLTAVLNQALAVAPDLERPLVLPPLRYLCAPYGHTFFGLEVETVEDVIAGIAHSVKASGGERLVLLNASPWNEELVESAALDLRADHGLRTYRINLADLGLDLHPGRSRSRNEVQNAASSIYGVAPEEPDRQGRMELTWFRPGRYDQPAPLRGRLPLDRAISKGRTIIGQSGALLASLFREITSHPEKPTNGEIRAPATDADSNGALPIHLYPGYRSRYLPAMSRTAIDALPGKQAAVVIIPVGAIEQHGPHLPVGTDAFIGQAWLSNALGQLPARVPAYAGPSITYGQSREHDGFPGTVSLTSRLLRQTLVRIARQLRDWGFQTMAVLNTHGGNSACLTTALREIQADLGLNAGMLRPSLARSSSDRENAQGWHAGEVETALMLEIAPVSVCMDKAVREYPAALKNPGRLQPGKAPASYAWLTRDLSVSGVIGDATTATRENGKKWLESGGAELADAIIRLADEADRLRRPEFPG